MHWVLNSPGKEPLALDKPQYVLGTAPGCDVALPAMPGIAVQWRLFEQAHGLWLQAQIASPEYPVHVNGRRIHELALIQAGDDLQFPGLSLRVSSAEPPLLNKIAADKPINFADRVLVRVWTGREAGKGYALVNSLCIGRSALSEIRIDDPALAERHVLIQRQGNDILVKNLSPLLEMRVQGCVCTEALLLPGAFFSIEQHRFQLQSPWQDGQNSDGPDLPAPQPVVAEAGPSEQPGKAPEPTKIFSRSQWFLLAAALIISGLFIALLVFAP